MLLSLKLTARNISNGNTLRYAESDRHLLRSTVDLVFLCSMLQTSVFFFYNFFVRLYASLENYPLVKKKKSNHSKHVLQTPSFD